MAQKQQDGATLSLRRRCCFLTHHFEISVATSAILLAAFVLFLLVGLSLTIIKPIYILSVRFAQNPNLPVTSVATELRFGVWGVCASGQTGQPSCFGPMIGYAIPPDILALTGSPELVDAISNAVLVLLVLHLVAAALAFVGVFTSLFLESHAMCIISLVATVFTLLVGLLVFSADLALVLFGKAKIGPLTQFNYSANWGPGVWMALAAVVLTFVGMILMSVVVCECCGVGRKAHHGHHDHHPGEKKDC